MSRARFVRRYGSEVLVDVTMTILAFFVTVAVIVGADRLLSVFR